MSSLSALSLSHLGEGKIDVEKMRLKREKKNTCGTIELSQVSWDRRQCSVKCVMRKYRFEIIDQAEKDVFIEIDEFQLKRF